MVISLKQMTLVESNSLTVSPVYPRVFVRNKSQTLSCDGVQFCGLAPCMSSAAPTCPKRALEPVRMFLKMLSFGLRNSGQSHVPGPWLVLLYYAVIVVANSIPGHDSDSGHTCNALDDLLHTLTGYTDTLRVRTIAAPSGLGSHNQVPRYIDKAVVHMRSTHIAN